MPVIPLAGALIFWLVATSLIDTAKRLDLEGVETQATVIERRIVQQRDPDGTSDTLYRLRVEFAGAGTVIERTFDVRRSLWNNAVEGATLPLRYLPSDPTVSELERGSQRAAGRVFMATSLVLLMTSLGAAAWLGSDLPALVSAHRRGMWREATVTAHIETRIKVNQTYLQRIQWRDETGAIGKSLAHRPDRLPALSERISVLVDPETGQSWWEADA